jgi:hypothetical protein
MRRQAIGDLDHACDRIRLSQRKFQVHLIADAKRLIDLQSNPFFRQIDDLAGKCLVSAPDDPGSVNRHTKELPLLGHG